MIFLIRSCIGSSNPGFDIPLFLYAKFHISAHNNLQSKQFFRNEDWGHCSFLIFSTFMLFVFIISHAVKSPQSSKFKFLLAASPFTPASC